MYANATKCHFRPILSTDLHYNEWLNLTYDVSCDQPPQSLSEFVLYTPGEEEDIFRLMLDVSGVYLSEFHDKYSSILTNETVIYYMNSNETVMIISISLKLTREVHGILNGALTAHGFVDGNGSFTGCTALPSVRYTIDDTGDDSTKTGI